MSKTLADLKKEIEYVKTQEKTARLLLGANEIYFPLEDFETSNKVRGFIGQYLEQLSGLRKELEEKAANLEGNKNES